MKQAYWLPISVLLDHGQVGVQADAHSGIKGHLEGSAAVLCANHGPQLLAVHGLLDLLEKLLEGLLVVVRLELQAHMQHQAGPGHLSTYSFSESYTLVRVLLRDLLCYVMLSVHVRLGSASTRLPGAAQCLSQQIDGRQSIKQASA